MASPEYRRRSASFVCTGHRWRRASMLCRRAANGLKSIASVRTCSRVFVRMLQPPRHADELQLRALYVIAQFGAAQCRWLPCGCAGAAWGFGRRARTGRPMRAAGDRVTTSAPVLRVARSGPGSQLPPWSLRASIVPLGAKILILRPAWRCSWDNRLSAAKRQNLRAPACFHLTYVRDCGESQNLRRISRLWINLEQFSQVLCKSLTCLVKLRAETC